MDNINNPLNVFKSSKDFSDPFKREYLPLVDVTEDLQWFPKDARVTILAKVATVPPIYNLKWYMTWNVLSEARRRGELDGIEVMVIASSGNTASAAVNLARYHGIKYVVVIVPADIPDAKLAQLQCPWVKVERYSERPGDTCIDRAARLSKKYGWFNFRQYEDENNWKGQKFMAEQLWEQTDGLLTVAANGMGTLGTLRGFREALPPSVAVVGAKPKEKHPIPGLRSESRLQPHFRHKDFIEIEVEKEESYATGMELRKTSLSVGPTTGAGALALKKYIERMRKEGRDQDIRNRNKDIVGAFVVCDLGVLYTERYTGALDAHYFSAHIPGLDD
jgi:cysteine synthase A